MREKQMPLRKGNQLPRKFATLVSRAERIDIAVAWARPCDAVEALARSDADIRIVVGISKNFTDPSTLKRLAGFEHIALRIVPDEARRIFHPKYFCFHGERSICWVGSANLTGGGFGGNVELVHEFELKRERDQEWFECLWADLNPDPWPEILEYEARYIPPGRTPRPAPPHEDADLPALADINTWEQFVEGLRVYDEYYRYHEAYGFDVLGETHSWLHTINTGHEIVLLNDWMNLTQRECRILRGFTARDDHEGNWGLLGTVRGGGTYVFNPTRMPEVGPIRLQIQEQITQAVQADPDEIVAVGTDAMAEIGQLQHVDNVDRGIGPAAATRWLALARPDYMVSVNNASASGLGEASGRPQNTNDLANVYADLLGWLHGQKWFNEFNGRQPDDPEEREIWNCRAALVDVFVYEA